MNHSGKYLIVSGDDFGISSAVNAGIIRAHCEGILTSASLMVSGVAFDEAVALAKAHPRLGVGIHIGLTRAAATGSPRDLVHLVDSKGNLPEHPVFAGFQYFWNGKIKPQLETEIEAQIQKFLAAGLTPSHIDGHLHFHVHPAILRILLRLAKKYAIPAFRLPREPLGVNLKADRGHHGSKFILSVIYRCLCRNAEKKLRALDFVFPVRFFGLLACGRMDESYLLKVIDSIEPGVTEIGMHPAVEVPSELKKWAPDYRYVEELRALISRRVKQKIQAQDIQLSNYHLLGKP